MKADLIVKGNKVFTGLLNQPEEAAVVIRGNKIVDVCSIEESRVYEGEGTKVLTYADQLIVPGFHDAHLHVMMGSLIEHFCVMLGDTKSEEEAAAKVKEYADLHPEDEWIIGFGWDRNAWERKQDPHKSSLDRLLPDRPVFLLNVEAHYGWANSCALERAHIDETTPAPEFGIIEKDEKGEVTGILHESAMALITKVAFAFPREKQEALLAGFLAHTAKHGITSVDDLYGSLAIGALDDYSLYKAFDKAGKLTTRLHFYPPLNGDIEMAKALRDEFRSEKLQMSGLKQFVDGVVTGHTAYMLEPYRDKPDSHGEPVFPEEDIKKWVGEADKEGFRVRLHAIGDRAIRLALDSFEEAKKANQTNDRRHAVEHVEVIHHSDISRFQELGVIASIQPVHLALMPTEGFLKPIGEERSPYCYMGKTLQDTGAKLSFSSDFPVAPINPMLGLHRAVTRMDYAGQAPWNEAEAIPLADAIRYYTIGGAYGVRREHELGTLEKGKFADIAVLDCDLFSIPAERIKDAKVVLTIMDGEIVYEASETCLFRA
ncbi:amidohydrolase [Brevibacillus brevis]|uniref:Amidohydrolase n=1 Tax=Brevibacillus brevis TaxID=1393 RepID=A0ABY9T4V4_BREBE|nr:amidohydrolase [Brevibacillus brevis]WNC15128.1 amidohydrolase [Brevibacillus brevis]